MAKSMIYEFIRNPLDDDSREMAVDGSTTPVAFRYVAPASGAKLMRCLIFYSDTGSFDATKFGNGITMTAGLEFAVVDSDGSTVKLDLLNGETIKTNADISAVCFDTSHLTMGTGPETNAARWTFSKAGAPLELETGDSFTVTVNDNLSGLNTFTIMVQGTHG